MGTAMQQQMRILNRLVDSVRAEAKETVELCRADHTTQDGYGKLLAIVATCAGIVLMHNHPSGNVEPSAEDLQTTRQLVEASRIMGIPLHDHVIISEGSYCSFAERGLL